MEHGKLKVDRGRCKNGTENRPMRGFEVSRDGAMSISESDNVGGIFYFKINILFFI